MTAAQAPHAPVARLRRLTGARTQADLQGVRRTLAYWRRLSDGLFKVFGFPVGLELLTFIPIVGGSYSLIVGLYLMLQAFRVQASFRVKLWMAFLLLVDVFIGEIPILGDAFDLALRAHARMADALEREMDRTWYAPERRQQAYDQGWYADRVAEMKAAGKKRLVFLG